MSDTPTPETDAAIIYRGKYAKIGDKWDRSQCGEITEPGQEGELISGAEWGDVVLLPADFACKLERERDAYKVEYESRAIWIERMNQILGYDNSDGFHPKPDPHQIAKTLVYDRDSLRARAAELEKSLHEYLLMPSTDGSESRRLKRVALWELLTEGDSDEPVTSKSDE